MTLSIGWLPRERCLVNRTAVWHRFVCGKEKPFGAEARARNGVFDPKPQGISDDVDRAVAEEISLIAVADG
ncbi:hypothetical protein LBMAG46_41970 [Planctomycetia bacterium]|nr:hypothetical protein LBMAG46_41970 [Planctomycetia bacterium]